MWIRHLAIDLINKYEKQQNLQRTPCRSYLKCFEDAQKDETKSGERRRNVRNNWTRVMEGKMQRKGRRKENENIGFK